jgi:hypothetical protein
MDAPQDLYRPTFIDIDLGAIAHNFSEVKKLVKTAKVMAVVKANAYGHGLIECAKHFEKLGTDYLGVALVEEGVELRRGGVKAPVLVFGGIVGGQIDQYLANDLDLTASSIDKLNAIEATAAKLNKKARIHIKIDTGMRRIGVRPESQEAIIEAALDAVRTIVKRIPLPEREHDEQRERDAQRGYPRKVPVHEAEDSIETKRLDNIDTDGCQHDTPECRRGGERARKRAKHHYQNRDQTKKVDRIGRAHSGTLLFSMGGGRPKAGPRETN